MIRKISKLQAHYHEVKSMSEYKTLSSKYDNYILNFTASWCGPCKVMSPTLIKLEQEANGKWALIRIDIDQQNNQQLIEQHQLEGVPTLVFFKSGANVHKQIGGMNVEKLKQKILQLF